MIIGVLSEQGGSLRNLAASGQAQRFVDQYLARYARHFERVYYFSYADEAPPLPDGCMVIGNRRRWHRWLYAFLLPLLHHRRFRECNVLRVMQMTGEVPAILAKALYGIPFAATYGYEYARNAELEGSGRFRAWLFRRRTRMAVRLADLVIVTNPALRGRIEQRIGATRVAFVPNGVDTSRFSPGPPRDAGNPVHLLAVGRLSPEKNLSLLLRAAARLPMPVVVRLVGAGVEEKALRQMALDLGVALELCGVVAHERLPELLRSADLFVITSRREGHPKALIEAMSCGCVCVGTRVEGIRDVITDGEDGLLAEPEDGPLAAALGRALADRPLRDRLRQRAREKATRDYDIDINLQTEVEALLRLGSARR
jgi:glycosyltransferase involved in cell wall biosynthesis